MAIAIVQSGVVTGGVTGTPFASPVTAGNMILMFPIEVINTGTSGFSIADNLNASVTVGATVDCAANWGVNGTVKVCYVLSTAGGTYTPTMTLNDPGDTSNCGIWCLELSGVGAVNGTPTAVALVSSTGWSIPPTGGPITNTVQPATMFAFAIDQNGNAITVGTGFTDEGAPNILASLGTRGQLKSLTTTGSQSPVFTSSNNFDNVAIAAIILAPSGGGGVSAALTGQRSTSAVGAIASQTAVALTGQRATSAAGAISPQAAVPLTGQAATSSVGAIGATTGVTAALTGRAATSAVGALSVALGSSLAGVRSTTAVGAVVATAGVAAALTGQVATSGVGALSAAIGVPLGGLRSTSAVGAVAAASGAVVALAGVAAISAVGALSAAIGVPLGGMRSTTAVGAVSAFVGAPDPFAQAPAGTTQAIGLTYTRAVGTPAPTRAQ